MADLADPLFSHRHARDLRWRFGTGAQRVLATAPGIPETGVVGTGNSVPVPVAPHPALLLRFGACDRALHAVGEDFAHILACAYGNQGSLATHGGMYPSRLWRAVAPFTTAAHEGTRAWLARQAKKDAPAKPTKTKAAKAESFVAYEQDSREHTPRDPYWRGDGGPHVVRWLCHCWDASPPTPVSPADKERMIEVEAQAKGRLAAAEGAFAAVYHPPPFWETAGAEGP